jgi:hypothetical protein
LFRKPRPREHKDPIKVKTPVDDLKSQMIALLDAGFHKQIWEMVDKLKREYETVSLKERDLVQLHQIIEQVIEDKLGVKPDVPFYLLKRDQELFTGLNELLLIISKLLAKSPVELSKQEDYNIKFNMIVIIAKKILSFPGEYQLTLKSILNQRNNLANYVEMKFPGYISSGLIHLLGRNQLYSGPVPEQF